MRTTAVGIAILVMLSLTSVAEPAPSLEDYRLLGVYSNCFEYLFAYIAVPSGTNSCLALTHLNGRTAFVRAGDPIGDYTVKSFNPRTERVFNPRTNSEQENKSGTVILRKNDGKEVTLDMGKPVVQTGLLGLLVNLKNGTAGYIRAGDVLDVGPAEANVLTVNAGSVDAVSDNRQLTILPPTAAEQQALANLWQSQQLAAAQIQKTQMALDVAANVVPVQNPAVPVMAVKPSRYVELTFNPLEIVSVTEEPLTIMSFTPPTGGARTDTGVALQPVKLTVPMPRFHKVSYSGTVILKAQ